MLSSLSLVWGLFFINGNGTDVELVNAKSLWFILGGGRGSCHSGLFWGGEEDLELLLHYYLCMGSVSFQRYKIDWCTMFGTPRN